MTLRTKLELIVGILFVALLAFNGVSCLRRSIADARADEHIKVVQQQKDEISKAIAERDRQWAIEREALVKSNAAAVTPQQRIDRVNAREGAHVHLIVPGGVPTQSAPIGSAIVSPEDQDKFYRIWTDYQLCSGDLAVCRKNLSGTQKLNTLSEDQTHASETARKGGVRWQSSWTATALVGYDTDRKQRVWGGQGGLQLGPLEVSAGGIGHVAFAGVGIKF